jgi:hypothetical protein
MDTAQGDVADCDLKLPIIAYINRCIVHALWRFSSGEVQKSVPADHSGCRVGGAYCLRPLEHWDRGFESHSGYGLCLRTVCLYVGRGLAIGSYAFQGAQPNIYKDSYIYKLILNWNRPENISLKQEKEEDKREKKKVPLLNNFSASDNFISIQIPVLADFTVVTFTIKNWFSSHCCEEYHRHQLQGGLVVPSDSEGIFASSSMLKYFVISD